MTARRSAPSRSRFGARATATVLSLGALALGALAPACSGTSVYDKPDPLECGLGSGCGMVICTCGDGSYAIDSRCEAGNCLDANEECKDRCGAFGAPSQVVSSASDTFGMASCEALDDRMLINGCKEGTELFSTECMPDATCSDESRKFWACIVGESVLSCRGGALHSTGCDVPPPLAICTPPFENP